VQRTKSGFNGINVQPSDDPIKLNRPAWLGLRRRIFVHRNIDAGEDEGRGAPMLALNLLSY
jgi:hypothetical protein